MRVALVGPFPLHPLTFGGGVEVSTWNLIQGLLSLGEDELHVVTLNSALRRPLHFVYGGVSYHYLPSRGRLQTATMYRQSRRRILETLDEISPDVVHAQDSQVYGYICLAGSHPVVVSVHGIVEEEAKFLQAPRDRMRAVVRSRVIQRYCITNSRHVIQPTRYPERHFSRLDTGQWHDTGNGIGPTFFEVEDQQKPGQILFAGAVIRLKRLLDLIDALAVVKVSIPHVVLRVAGSTPDASYLAEVKDRIVRLGLEGNVELLGPCSPRQMLDEYAACQALVLPSGQENSPMVIAEAMASGTAVVATRVGGVLDLMDDGTTGFSVNVGDISQLARRIEMLLSDADLRSKMGAAARQKAMNQYRSEVVAAKVREVYEMALSEISH